jgi:hypothetical protein
VSNADSLGKVATGENLPDALTMCFYEDTPTVKHLVIPVNSTNEELSESQLEMVAGGLASTTLPIIAGLKAVP